MDLIEEFQSNSIRANGRFKGKTIEVIGLVGTVEEVDGRPLLTFSLVSKKEFLRADQIAQYTPDQKKWYFDGYLPVKCYIDPAALARFSNVDNGDKIIIRGVLVGGNKDVITLEMCVFVRHV